MTAEERITALEARLAGLEARLAALEARTPSVISTYTYPPPPSTFPLYPPINVYGVSA